MPVIRPFKKTAMRVMIVMMLKMRSPPLIQLEIDIN